MRFLSLCLWPSLELTIIGSSCDSQTYVVLIGIITANKPFSHFNTLLRLLCYCNFHPEKDVLPLGPLWMTLLPFSCIRRKTWSSTLTCTTAIPVPESQQLNSFAKTVPSTSVFTTISTFAQPLPTTVIVHEKTYNPAIGTIQIPTPLWYSRPC